MTKTIVDRNIIFIYNDIRNFCTGNNRMSSESNRRIRELEIKNRILRMVVAALIIIMIAGAFILNSKKEKPAQVNILDSVYYDICFDAEDDIKEKIDENYLRYLNMAYVLIGDYPDCEYYKISANVARNDYNWEKDFYVDEGKLYYNYYKDGKASGKVAVDVSEFQRDIDWEKVKNAGVKVAIVRVGFRGYGESGTIVADNMAETNIKGAKAAGLETPVYFFSSAINREEGVEEAQFVINKIKGFKLKQPVIIDTEYVFDSENARANNISVKDRTDAVVGFCETVEAAGYTPMIYASRDQFIKYLDIDRIGKWEFWLAAYDPPVFPYHTEGYQYSPYGYVDGIETQVDLNVWMR